MFNNIIYFIIILLIFNISYPDKASGDSLLGTLTAFTASWIIFAACCRWSFRRLRRAFAGEPGGDLTSAYQNLTGRLSILAIFLFAADVYFFRLRYWLDLLPGVKRFTFLEGALALGIFLFYLGTVWYFSYPMYRVVYQSDISRRTLIISNIKLNLPIVFPWLILTLVYDFLSLTPWSGPDSFINQPLGQFLFFAVFLIILMIFLPHLIQYLWGCRPFEPSPRVRELEAFLAEKGFRYRHLLRWPIFEGRMMTAGIMGIVPRYRYLLVTDALMGILTVQELKAVLVHEMGHAKYCHLFFYILFLLGYMVLSFGLFDFFSLLFATQPFLLEDVGSNEVRLADLYYLLLSLPILLSMLIYFRYVMGFFMRNFERQADIYSAVQMGDPGPTISSLEKIALLSGKSRDLPSWHHFSIRERVEYLWRLIKDPGLARRHNRFVALAFIGYLILVIALGWFLNLSSLQQGLTDQWTHKMLKQQLLKSPDNALMLQQFADVSYRRGRYREAIQAYEKILQLYPGNAMGLNNLAWYLVTVPDGSLRDPQRALNLALRAVALKRLPMYLDTLAEAYFANGLTREAIRTSEEALSLVSGDRTYYEKQLRKFQDKKDQQPA